MMNDGKENIRHVMCKNHTARPADRELYRICPSKLSKQELEDLYFSMLDSNTQLKKTVNGQRDQLKVLTTKVQRMTVQKHSLGSHNKDCCVSNKAIINEQKESISDLKKANERLSDRIRLLNMRLCSAKQFLRRSPGQPTSRCSKCCLASNTSIKNSSMSALHIKESNANLQTDITSSLYLNKGSSTARAGEVVSNHAEMKTTRDEPCQQNKCRSVMEELKQKIENLEEELSKTHEQYSERMRKLGEEVTALREENLRIRALQTNVEHKLEVNEKEAGELLHKLRNAEIQCENLATQLQIEKGKVSELEMQVRATDISSQVAKALETHINTVIAHRKSQEVQSNMELPTIELCPSDSEYNPLREPNNSNISPSGIKSDMIKNSDDSGYTENNKSQEFDDKKKSSKIDQNILDEIASLQTQLDNLKLSIKDSTGEDIKCDAIVDTLQKSNLDSNEAYNVVGAFSSFSNVEVNVFQTSKMKPTDKIEQYRSDSRAPDVLNEDTHVGENNQNLKNLLDRDNGITFQNGFNSIKQSGIIKKSSLDETLNVNENQSVLLPKDIEINRNGNINESNANVVKHNNKKEIFDGNNFVNKRRTSLRRFKRNQSSKDLSVSSDETQIIVGRSTNISEAREGKNKDMPSQGNDIVRIQNDSIECKISERQKIDENDNLDSVINKQRDNDGIVTGTSVNKEEDNKNVDVQNLQETNNSSPNGTGTGNSTYIVEVGAARSKLAKDATFHVEKENNHLGPETNKLTCHKSQMLKPLCSSTPNHQKTYNIEGFADMTRSTSPDNTEHEISSMTDLPNEIEDKSSPDYISPGEEKPTSTFTDSYAAATTTDYGSLSEGELPITAVKRLSFAEIDMKYKTTDTIALSPTSYKMEETLRAISEELTRCKELLRGKLPAQVIPDLRSDFRFVKY